MTSCSSIQPRRMYSSSIRWPSAPEHWSVFCFAETSCAQISAGPGRPAEPDAREERLRGRPRLDDRVRRERPEARQRVLAEVELAVGDVLDDEEPVPPRQLDQRLAPLDRQRHARRVLVVGDRVEELRPQPVLEHAASSSTWRPSSSIGTASMRASNPRKAMIAPRYVGASIEHGVAAVEERLADELERLDPAARDQQLVLGRAAGPAPTRAARRRRRACRRARASACTGTRSPRRSPRTPRAAARRARAGTSAGRGSRRRTRSGPAGRGTRARTRCRRRRRRASARRTAAPSVRSPA